MGGNQGGIIYTHITLAGVLVRAYSVTPSEIVGPSWLNEKFYDIVAKVPDGALTEQIPEMLQNLLAVRFGMRVHWDIQQKGGYALVKGNKSLKLMRSVSNPEGVTICLLFNKCYLKHPNSGSQTWSLRIN